NGTDFTGTTTVTIPAGASSAAFSIPAIQDSLGEGNESFNVSITSASGGYFENLAVASSNSVTTTIIDDDIPVVSSVSSGSVAEGSYNTFTVTLSNASTTTTTTTLALTSGTATVGTDTSTVEYSTNGGTSWNTYSTGVSVPAGATSFLVRVATVADFIHEGNESYTLTATANSGSAVGGGTITNVNHAPTALADTVPVNENASVTATATTGVLANDTDVDIGDSKTVSAVSFGATTGTVGSALTGTYGTLTLNANGSYSYSANTAAAEALGSGVTATDNFSYTVRDASGATSTTTLGFTVTGVNDAPSTTGASVTSSEDTAKTLSWANFNITDVDGGPSQAIVITSLPANGTLQYSTNGVTWTTISVAGQTVLKSNIDAGYLRFVPASNESGIDAYGGTGTGNKQADYASFTYQPVDGASSNGTGNTGTMTIDITPVADAPNLSLAVGTPAYTQTSTSSGTSIGYDTYSVKLSSALTDTDGSETLSSITLTGVPSAVSFSAGTKQADGSWTLTQSQLSGLTMTVASGTPAFDLTARVTSAETANPGSTSTSTSTLHVDTNHAPVAVADTAIAVEAGGTGNGTAGTNPSGNVLTNDLIIDTGEAKAVASVAYGSTTGSVGSALTGAYGSLVLNADGTYTYTVDNTNTTVQALRTSSNTLTDTFTYTAKDASGTTSAPVSLTVTIQGANDAPVANPDVNLVTRTGSTNVSVATTVATGVLANDTDVDNGDTERVSAITKGATTQAISAGGSTTIAGTYGNLTIYSDGHYTYTTTGSRPSSNVQDTFTYTVRDSGNLESQANLVITVDRANAAPTATAGVVTGTEDTALVFSWSNFNINDADGVSSALGVSIRSVPTDGLLQTSTDGVTWTTITAASDGSPVTVSKSTIDAGYFRFVPDTNESGSDAYANSGTGNMLKDYATFNYRGTDGITTNGTNVSMSINITPVADDPIIKVGGVSVIDGTVQIATPPASEGLTVRQYNNVSTVSTGDVDTATEVLSLLTRLDSATVTSSTVSTAPQNYTAGSGSPSGIPTDGAYRTTGLIYMEAGHTYTFSSYQDDTALLSIGGTVVLAKAYNSWGNITASTYSPTVSGYYTIDWAVYNGDSVGAFKPYLSVDGATAQDLTAGNFKIYGSIASLEAAGGTLHGDYFAVSGSGGYYPVNNTSVEDTVIKLSPITVTLADSDGSEVLASVVAQNLLVGSVLSDGTNSFTATAGTTSVDITSWNLATLTIKPPLNFSGDYALSLVATSRETATNATSSNTTTITIPVAGVADAPTAVADTASLTEDSGTYLASGNVLANDSDPDGDAISLSAVNNQTALLGVDVAGAYGYFHLNANGSYTYSLLNDNARVNSLNSGESLTDQVSYTVTDATGLSSSSTLTVTIIGSTDSYTTANTITGTIGADSLTGTSSADLIHSLAGNDYVEAGAGNDVVRSGDAATTATQAQLAASTFMTTADAGMTSSTGLLNVADASNKGHGDLVNGGDGNDALIGTGSGSHLFYGGAGDDYLIGGSASDALRGGAGSDRIDGGAGSDVMRGDLGADVFAWSLGTQAATAGTTLAGAGNIYGVADGVNLAGTSDLVTDFSKAEGDALDLRDLLVGESHLGLDTGNLSNYLHFEVSNGNTVVHVSTSGGFANGNYDATREDQTIVLQGVNLLNDGAATLLNDNAVIQDMLKNNRLIVD
ncbi:Ig-like domain-containing protein, partial [Uliginosibacterium sp. 31-16]|uniref:beta strand repeat-containing protein n=1 Tax=Uliginosibacterium sp. 31-16 TaxID=3068315 RepID=UPI00273D2647